jgi:3-oxoacyl-[acyl-carrier protein] reductase
MSQKLVGRVAVVTGASKGIGAGIAQALAEEGASVVVNYSSSKREAERVVAEISARGSSAIAVQGDVSKPAHIERLFAEATRSFGRLDILVNNAGMYEFASLEAVTEEHFHNHFDLNGATRTHAGAAGRHRPTAVYLASSDSKYMTGETLLVSGGLK